MQLSQEAKDYISKQVRAKAQTKLDKLVREAMDIEQDLADVTDEIEELEDDEDDLTDDEETKLYDAAEKAKKIIRKQFPEFREIFKKAGFNVTNKGLEYVLIESADDYGAIDAWGDNHVTRDKKSKTNKAKLKALKAKAAVLEKALTKANAASEHYRAKINDAVQETTILCELGAGVEDFKKIIREVKI